VRFLAGGDDAHRFPVEIDARRALDRRSEVAGRVCVESQCLAHLPTRNLTTEHARDIFVNGNFERSSALLVPHERGWKFLSEERDQAHGRVCLSTLDRLGVGVVYESLQRQSPLPAGGLRFEPGDAGRFREVARSPPVVSRRRARTRRGGIQSSLSTSPSATVTRRGLSRRIK
jgi:hypothetical protein